MKDAVAVLTKYLERKKNHHHLIDDGIVAYTRYSRKVPGLVHFKQYLTSNHYESFQITNHIHFLYFSDKLRKEYARIVLKCRLTYGIYEGTEHFEKSLNQIFGRFESLLISL